MAALKNTVAKYFGVAFWLTVICIPICMLYFDSHITKFSYMFDFVAKIFSPQMQNLLRLSFVLVVLQSFRCTFHFFSVFQENISHCVLPGYSSQTVKVALRISQPKTQTAIRAQQAVTLQRSTQARVTLQAWGLYSFSVFQLFTSKCITE